MTSVIDFIVRLQPYSPGLKAVIKKDPGFAGALKVNNPRRFVSAGAIMITRSPLVPEDKIIGFYVYDYKEDKFKQDFIVDIEGKDKEFVLYTGLRRSSGKRVKHIKEFFDKYGKNQYYLGHLHHPKFEDLPDPVKPNAIIALELAKRLKGHGLRKLTNQEFKRFDSELRKLGL